jgi:uncharacterized DUF497 family protein
MPFEWSEAKALSNLQKHGVRFEEAATVFDDPLGAIFGDPDHSEEETRFVLVGRSEAKRLLIVSYTERQEVTRIISARPVTRKEQRDYATGNDPYRGGR